CAARVPRSKAWVWVAPLKSTSQGEAIAVNVTASRSPGLSSMAGRCRHDTTRSVTEAKLYQHRLEPRKEVESLDPSGYRGVDVERLLVVLHAYRELGIGTVKLVAE